MPGSPHGYDIIDPTRFNPELGGADGFDALASDLKRRSMGLLLDTVPNHMVAGSQNAWWADVLEHGRDSEWAAFFDIDWSAGGKVVLPVLGGPLAEVLAGDELQVESDGDRSWLRYHDRRFPLRSGTDTSSLEDALSRQHYVLTHWREGVAKLNYRRFFDVNDLAGVRQEDEHVFNATHALVRQLLDKGSVSGLRIDHIDGLYDPAAYLQRLADIAPNAYLLVEKVLAGDEELPESWPVEGTTGYEFLNAANSLFVDPDGLEALRDAYVRFTGRSQSFAEVVFEAKRQVARELFPVELARLARDLGALAERLAPDLGEDDLKDAIVATAAAFPVYRTYVAGLTVSQRDRDVVERALAAARGRISASAAIDALGRVLLLDVPEAQRTAALDFVMRWQQFTGPLAAKGLEDTALYRYNVLVSMNEVGANPDGPRPMSIAVFHEFSGRRLARTPHALNATATHDTKRGEDVRARLNVLSELAGEWAERQRGWSEITSGLRLVVEGEIAPAPNDETLVYQTLVGAWPLDDRELPEFRERLRAYVIKAAREAKEHTSWLDPNQEYERALTGFAEALFDSQPFLDAFLPFQRRIAELSVTNSLAQVVLKIASPGVPDVYQGTEFWDLSLVDPDNRRPVDFEKRARLLNELAQLEPSADFARGLLESWQDGRIKLYVTHRVLSFRRDNAALFSVGEYVPLEVTGEYADNVLAFARQDGDSWAIAAVPRLTAHLGALLVGESWGDTRIQVPLGAPAAWRNVLTNETLSTASGALSVASTFSCLPVALLAAALTGQNTASLIPFLSGSVGPVNRFGRASEKAPAARWGFFVLTSACSLSTDRRAGRMRHWDLCCSRSLVPSRPPRAMWWPRTPSSKHGRCNPRRSLPNDTGRLPQAVCRPLRRRL